MLPCQTSLIPAGESLFCEMCRRTVNRNKIRACKGYEPKPEVVTSQSSEELTPQELGFLFGQLISCPVGLSEGLVL